MNHTFTLWLATIFLVLGISALGAEHPELKIFSIGQGRHGPFRNDALPKGRGEEDDFMVEIIVGKTMPTDGINQMWLDNTLEPRLLEGWGYPYYEVTGSSSVMGTMMAVPEGITPVKRFVSAFPLQVRYNSRLPIVVYAPKDTKSAIESGKPPTRLRRLKRDRRVVLERYAPVSPGDEKAS